MINSSSTSTAYLDRDMHRPEVHKSTWGQASVLSARCPGKITPNEDAAAVIAVDSDTVVLAVADGMGGAAEGENASALAVACLAQTLSTVTESDGHRVRHAIIDGIENANRCILDLGVGAATTLAVVEIHKNKVRPYHIGDSSILVTGQKGKLKFLTVAHSPVGYAVAAGLLNEVEAMYHEKRHYVSNMVGSDDMRIEVGTPIELASRDSLVLASDGLTDNLMVHEVVELIRKGPLSQATGQLADAARERMRLRISSQPSKPDDLTVVAFRLASLRERSDAG
jgi:serine/threonine protein phosphatase PrpC